MKKFNVLLLIVSVFIFLIPSISTAGSFMLGMKGWYAFWDGAPNAISGVVDDYLDNEIETSFDPMFTGLIDSEINSSEETGKGILAGPILAYQTDDRLWSFSLAFMYLSDFQYDTSSGGTFTVGAPENLNGITTLNYSIELKRREIDASVSRSLSSRIKVYAGYKYQSLENNLDVSGTIYESTTPINGVIDSTTEITIYSHIPTAGAGFVLPLSESAFLGLQAGVIYIIPKYESKIKDNNSGMKWSESSNFEKTFGINMEASISLLSREKLLFQLGYRYQGMRLKKSETAYSGSINVWDRFQGVTISVLYLFDP